MIFRESGKKAETVPTLSVIGMDGLFGTCDGVEQIRDALYFGAHQNAVSTDQPFDRKTIAFSEDGFGFVDQLPTTDEQKLGLRVGLRALKDAGMDIQALAKQRIAVLYASSSGSQALSYYYAIDQLEDHLKAPVNQLEKILKMSGINGGIYDLSNFISPLTAGIMLAEKILRSKKADLVVLVMVGLNSQSEASQTENGQTQASALDGAGAIVLQTSLNAKRLNRREYCQIQGVAISQSAAAVLDWQSIKSRVNKNLYDLLEMTSTTLNEIGAVEICETDRDEWLQIPLEGLNNPDQPGGLHLPTCAVGSVASVFPHLHNVAEMAGLIKMALQFSERIICGNNQWDKLIPAHAAPGSQVYIPDKSRTWYLKRYQPERLGLFVIVHNAEACTHMMLSETSLERESISQSGVHLEQFFIPICGDSEQELMDQLVYLQTSLLRSMNLTQLQQFWIRKWEKRDKPAYIAVFLGSNSAEFLREIQFAEQGIPKSIERGSDWQTPSGSYFSPNPLGPDGKIAFVYPGAFNSQIHSGKDLFYRFPELHQYSKRISERVGDVLFEEKLFPRLQTPLTESVRAELNQTLLENPIVMLSSGTTLAVLYTLVLKEFFGVKPDMSFGYSLGENSMMFAAGVWNQGDAAMQRLQQSALFNERISGKQSAVREFWELDQSKDHHDAIWANYILMADAEAIKPEIEKTDKVYLTHINTPRQVVIGGSVEACESFIRTHKLNSIKAPFNHALHCEPVRSEWHEFHYLHDWPVHETPDQDLYTAANYAKSAINPEGIAKNIAHALTSPLDFPRLVNTVYDDGARIFIEAGAGSNCSKWVDQILKKTPHVSMSISQHGVGDGSSVLRCLAKCVSHRVPLSLEKLYGVQRQPVPVAIKG